MSFAAAALPALIGGAASVVGSVLSKPKVPKTPAAMQQPVAQTRQTSAVLDAVAGRRGSLANQRTGPRGVESTAPGQKSRLGA